MTFTREEIADRGHPVWAEIDLDAISRNVAAIRTHVGSAEVMGVVKGYAYGHGNPESARAMVAGGATRLGVARVAEAIHLREAGLTVPIHVFTEPPPDAARTLVALDLTTTIYTLPFAEALSAVASDEKRTVAVHVKLDTGMHRVGLLSDDIPGAIERVAALPGIEVEGVWSHLAVADVPDHPFTQKQLDLFADLVSQIERAGIELRYRHIANSAAALFYPASHLDLVRCGIAAYGLWPNAQIEPPIELSPAMSVRARVNMVKRVPAGEGLSYGLEYEVPRDARVVTVPAGYADGYDRRLSGRADVLIDGTRYKVSGTVCMDQFMVDVGDAEVEVGAIATLLGRDGAEQVTAEELATQIGTINYEVTTRIPSRVPRVFLGGTDGE